MTTQENLLKLMSLPPSRFSGVVRDSDGNYLAQIKGDLGYNAFLGRPAPLHPGPGQDYMLATWKGLTLDERVAVWHLAQCPVDGEPIKLHEDFGVPKLDK